MNDKQYEKFRRKCAELEHGDRFMYVSEEYINLKGIDTSVQVKLPKYVNETDILRVVRLLSDAMLREFYWELDQVVGGDGNEHILTATAEQMQEALCSVFGIDYQD